MLRYHFDSMICHILIALASGCLLRTFIQYAEYALKRKDNLSCIVSNLTYSASMELRSMQYLRLNSTKQCSGSLIPSI